RLTANEVIRDHRAYAASRSRQAGRHQYERSGRRIRRQYGAAIEPEPAEPQDQSANCGERHVATGDRRHFATFAILANARSEEPNANECSPAADRMHEGRTGE